MRFIIRSTLPVQIKISILKSCLFIRLNIFVGGDRSFGICRNMRILFDIPIEIFIARGLSKTTGKFSVFAGSPFKIANIRSISSLFISKYRSSMSDFISSRSNAGLCLKNFLFNFLIHSIEQNDISDGPFRKLYNISSDQIFKNHIDKD